MDDIAILSVSENLVEATENLQKPLDQMSEWYKRWRIRVNELKSVHVIYAHRKVTYQPVKRIDTNSVKHLGMNLDAKLSWKDHIRLK